MKITGFTPEHFAKLMQRELDSNSHKGDWTTWNPKEDFVLGELHSHIQKLESAVHENEPLLVTEFAADVANIAMKIAELYGEV